jgi:hypothetical protein
MMIELVQTGYKQDVVPDFEDLVKLMEDGGKEQFDEQECTKIGENRSRVNRRWPRPMTFDEAYRTPSLFTWRC